MCRVTKPNVWRQWRAQRSGASPLHAGVRPRRELATIVQGTEAGYPRGARGGSGAPPVQNPR